MEYAIGGVMEPTENYFEESNQEDFAISMIDILLEDDITYLSTNCSTLEALPMDNWPFTVTGVKGIDSACYYDVLDNRLNIIMSEYEDIDLEIREYKDVYFTYETDTYRIRFLKDMETINTSFFVTGRSPLSDLHIAVAETFAKSNNLELGDRITINETIYTISGFVLFPDYNLPMFGSDFILDNKTQTVGMLADNAFESMEESTKFEVAGVFTGTMDVKTFDNKIIDTYRDNDKLSFVTNVLQTENNTRSGAIYAELSGGRAYGILLSLLVASIALMIVGIMVSRVLHSQRGPIGILKSLGYTNNQIAFPYILFIGVMTLPTVIIGYYLGLLAATPFKDIFMSFYLLPSNPIEQNIPTIIVAVVVPLGFILGLSFLIVRRLLSQKPVTLLNPEVTSKSNFITKRVGKYLKRLKITAKLQHLLLYRNIVKFLVFLIGMFYAAFLILFSFSLNGIFDRMLYDYYENTDHEYIGICEFGELCSVTGDAEKVIELPGALLDDENVIITGLSDDSSLHPLFDKKGKEITSLLSEGIVITESLRILNGVKIGDMLVLDVGTDSVEIEVVGITKEYSGEKAYMDIVQLSNMLVDTDDYYNAVYSSETLDEDDYDIVISTNDIVQQATNMQGFFNTFILMMTISSIVIGGIIIYILTVMTIEDNFYNISLFKVIGYNEKEINKMILGGYSLYGVIIFILAIPVALISFYLMEMIMGEFYGILLPFQFIWWHAPLSIGIFLVIFYIGAFQAKRRLTKVSLQEAMKMYQI
jgi:putative ABC transport system permease protein